MDDMSDRRSQLDSRRRRHQDVKSYGRQLRQSFARYGASFKTHKQSLLAIALLAILTLLLFGIFSQLQAPNTHTTPGGVTAVNYGTFVEEVKAGNVLAVAFRGDSVYGLSARPLGKERPSTATPTTSMPDDPTAEIAAWTQSVNSIDITQSASSSSSPAVDVTRNLYTRLPASGDITLMPLLLSQHVTIKMVPVPLLSIPLGLLLRFIPMVLLALIVLVMLSPRMATPSKHTMDDRITPPGKSRARLFVRGKESDTSQPGTAKPATSSPGGQTVAGAELAPPVTFADVAGIDEVRAELEEIVRFLRDSERFRRLGAHIPHGALLVGPPGTGKTLLARAVAGEAGVPFFS